MKKVFNTFILVLTFVMSLMSVMKVLAFAHNSMLDVDYDNCEAVENGDGINEKWYALEKSSLCRHLNDEITTIKYFFADNPNTGYTWTSDITESQAEEIKRAYITSMEKWNNVYYYLCDDSGVVTKRKIINIEEGTETDRNLLIYPMQGSAKLASTYTIANTEIQIETGDVSHNHYTEWEMFVYIDWFYVHSNFSYQIVNLVRNRVGAHELGHVLGLRDLDSFNLCNADNSEAHHQEVLMGYGKPLTSRTANISYKDIAGVAITRGWHTDYDHKWLLSDTDSIFFKKIICSICNGVKTIPTALVGTYEYEIYGSCNNNHDLASGNMMAVASYGTKDYYKCKYCRYVAPFEECVEQNYTITYIENSSIHRCVNNVNGLEYTFYENHNFIDHECIGCGESLHSFTDHYIWQSEGLHRAYCECGEFIRSSHTVRAGSFTGDGYGICLLCRGRVFMGTLNSITVNLPHTDNGSFILPSGITVLVDADMEAYYEGTLEFYVGEKE